MRSEAKAAPTASEEGNLRSCAGRAVAPESISRSFDIDRFSPPMM
jgi:hypothetical protein